MKFVVCLGSESSGGAAKEKQT